MNALPSEEPAIAARVFAAELAARGTAAVTPRRRAAPVAGGHRTTVTVPDDLWRLATEIADELALSPVDALLVMAQRGGAVYAQGRAMRRTAVERIEALRRGDARGPSPAELPTDDELAHAAGALRRGD